MTRVTDERRAEKYEPEQGRPKGSNADEWAVFLEHWDVKEHKGYLAVQIATALDDADKQIAEQQKALDLAEKCLEEAEAILGGEYGDTHRVLMERMFDLRDSLKALNIHGRTYHV